MGRVTAMDLVRKAQEEEYFGQQNTGNLNKIRIRAELRDFGIEEESLRNALVDSGFNTDSVRALMFFPLVQIAWATGSVEFEEKMAIEKILIENGVDEESAAYELIFLWLEEEVPEENMRQLEHLTDQVIHEMLKSQSRLSMQILDWAQQVANAYAGLLSFGGPNMTEEESLLIEAMKQKYS